MLQMESLWGGGQLVPLVEMTGMQMSSGSPLQLKFVMVHGKWSWTVEGSTMQGRKRSSSKLYCHFGHKKLYCLVNLCQIRIFASI